MAIDPQEILGKVMSLPIADWRYNRDATKALHMGPMAEDSSDAFGLGATNKGIATIDSSGVALAAIQGLNAKLEQREETIEALHEELQALKKVVHALVAKDTGFEPNDRWLIPATVVPIASPFSVISEKDSNSLYKHELRLIHNLIIKVGEQNYI